MPVLAAVLTLVAPSTAGWPVKRERYRSIGSPAEHGRRRLGAVTSDRKLTPAASNHGPSQADYPPKPTTMRSKERTLKRLQTELEGAQLSKVEGEDEKKGERAMMVVTCC